LSGKRPARVDAHGDPLPEGVLFQLGSLRWHSPGGAAQVAFAADRRTLLSLMPETGRVGAWEVVGGTLLRSWKLETEGPIFLPLRLTAGGTQVRGAAALWNAATGKRLLNLADFDRDLRNLVIAADGKTLIGLTSHWTVARWDIAGKQRLQAMPVPMGRKLDAVAYYRDGVLSGDGKLLAAFSLESTVHMFDTTTGKELRKLTGHKEMVLRCAFSPDGRYLATAAPSQTTGVPDEPVLLWDVTSGKVVQRLRMPRPNPDGTCRLVDDFLFAFSADGKFLAGWNGYWSEEPVCVWELDTGKVRQFAVFPEIPATLALSRDGKLLAAGTQTGTMLVWNTGDGKLLNRLHAGTEYFLTYPRYAAGGRGLVAEIYPARGTRRTPPEIGWWDIATGTRTRTLPGHEILGLSPDGQRMFVRDHEQVARPLALVDVLSGKVLRRSAPLPAWSVFSQDGKRLAVLDDKIRIINVTDGKLIREFTLPLDEPGESFEQTATISPDLEYIVHLNAAPGRVRLWSTATKKELWRAKAVTPAPRGRFPCLAFSGDGKCVVMENGGIAVVWDSRTGKRLLDLKEVWAQGFLPDARTLAVQHSGMNLVSRTSGKIFTHLNGPGTDLLAEQASAVSSGSQWRQWSSGRDLTLGDKSRRSVRFTFSRGITTSPDGKIVVTAGGKSIWLWEAVTGKLLRHFKSRAPSYGLAYAPDGKTLLAGEGPIVVVWDITGLELAAQDNAIPVPTADFERLWADVASSDGKRFFRAYWRLAADPEQTVARLRKRLHPIKPLSASELEKLLRSLNSDRFSEREQATRDLQRESAIPGLRKALARSPSLETGRRISLILANLDAGPMSNPERLRSYRVVQLLEQIRTADARRFLGELAGGAGGAMLTDEASAALARVVVKSD